MNATKRFRSLTSLALVFGMALILAGAPGLAWGGLREDMRDLRGFLRDHPRISADLRANPDLMNNRRYLDRHEDLAHFLRQRPALRSEVRADPRRVMGTYYSYDRYDRYDRYQPWR
jgi:hypothetical protein